MTALTWNCEGVKNGIFELKETLDMSEPDLAFLDESQLFSQDLDITMSILASSYCYSLNSDDMHDSDLALTRSKSLGGTLVLWKKELDPFVTILAVDTPAFVALLLQIPEYKKSIHIALYLPTSGKDQQFVSELTNLRACLEKWSALHPDSLIFIRGDSNVNKNNVNRNIMFQHFLTHFTLKSVPIPHPTYHHFTGNGKHDSNIDILLHSSEQGCNEWVTKIMCKHQFPMILSHHDIILSSFTLLPGTIPVVHGDLPTAPRIPNQRQKVVWTTESSSKYRDMVEPLLKKVRSRWLDPDCQSSMSIMLQMTNFVMNLTAKLSCKVVSLASKPQKKALKTPIIVRKAMKKLKKAHHIMRTPTSTPERMLSARAIFSSAQRQYRRAIRLYRHHQNQARDKKLHEILSDNPSSLYSYIRNCRKKSEASIDKLVVGDKTYSGKRVPDGFFDSMTSLKTCNMAQLQTNPLLAQQLSNCEHILKLCQNKFPVPPISLALASRLLHRIKRKVLDFYSITASHYLNAGNEGTKHFQDILNTVIGDVNNATAEELNVAHGLILFKGHKKEKTSDRSYRTISSCPFLSKALDLYLRDLYQDYWDDCQAPTQFQGTGSSHDVAALLVTEVIQYSLNVLHKPLYLLALDAQSAFDRCLRQILVCELFKAGMKGEAVKIVNNRLSSRATVYEWNSELLGPGHDATGFEQGGINSSEFYKLYNNEQLETAQSSRLGVDLKSGVISAIGQADDVVLVSNSLDSLRLLLNLTKLYCDKYRVLLVPSKTRLLAFTTRKTKHLSDIAKLSNMIEINGHGVQFEEEVEHVGITRSTSGNLPHIMNRIAAYKGTMASVLSAGLAKGHQGNPAAGLRVHQLYAAPRFFSGLASLVLSEPEIKLVELQLHRMLERLQKLHGKTPRCYVHLLAGTLPGRALLHLKQLSLFMMICHMPGNPIHYHAKCVLTTPDLSSKSWFVQIRNICLLYGLCHPLPLLENPPPKKDFKAMVKDAVTKHWEGILKEEAASLSSLQFFAHFRSSLRSVHPLWLSAGNNTYEVRKSEILAVMTSGRYRSEYLCRHWSDNRHGYCEAGTCTEQIGNLEHLLLHCPALTEDRKRLWSMFYMKSARFPALLSFLQEIEMSPSSVKLQFLLDPLAFSEVLDLWHLLGQDVLAHIYYLIRTFAYYMFRRKQILTGKWSHNQTKSTPKSGPKKITANFKNQVKSSLLLGAVTRLDFPSVPGDGTTILPQRVHWSGELTRSVATRQAQQDQSDLPSEHSASDPDYEALPSASSDIIAYSPAQTLSPPQFSHLVAQPWLDCPRGVVPAIAAPASSVLKCGGCDWWAKCQYFCGYQQLVPEISGTQYQDSTLGFCGGWGSHDCTIQVPSQSNIYKHP